MYQVQHVVVNSIIPSVNVACPSIRFSFFVGPFYIHAPLGFSPAGVVLGPEASPTRAKALEGQCGVDRTRALN